MKVLFLFSLFFILGLSNVYGQVSCSANKWACDNNKQCVWRDWRCDGEVHCGDGSDEKHCEHWNCSPNWWKCKNNKCIPYMDRCDGNDDCGDSTDEQNCACPKANQWRCNNEQCIWNDWRCNGEIQCADGSDEERCESWKCSPTWWKCKNNRCIWKPDRCNGVDDCGDGSDEDNCEQWICPTGRWKCNNNHCISNSTWCNGHDDCGDGSDEKQCEHRICPTGRWKCSNNRCISKSIRCNGHDDCGDGSDEKQCDQWQCVADMWSCSNHRCISNSSVCDGTDDCGDGDDEKSCGEVSVGPPYFTSKEPFTLTCNASDLDPPLNYTWSGVTCDKQEPGNTCTFTPDREADDLKNVTCTATSSTSGIKVSETVQLISAYPPTGRPDIQLDSTQSEELWMGDRLTCTVTGGKPLVDSVHFSCVNPDLPDQDDKINETSVSSSVTVNSAHDVMGRAMVCVCDATWKVKQEYYKLSTASALKIEHPPNAELVIEKQSEGRDYLRPGDSLTCTVTAGNPPVESVDFYCFNPDLHDEDDIVSAISVSSSLYVHSSPDVTNKPTRCACDAILKIKSEIYKVTSSSTYRFEHNPSNVQLSVGPSHFINNGSQTSTLTCNAADVYPPPKYTWSGITCENQFPENTCTFTPDHVADDLKTVTCSAKTTKIATSKTLQLNFSYPPPQKPKIQSENNDIGKLRIGDKLTCTVTGGKPLVDSVYFYCKNPDLPDKIDNVSETSVTSFIIVTSAHRESQLPMTCFCNATWKRKPDYYQQSVTSLVMIEDISTSSPSENSQCDLVIQAHAAGRDLLTTGDTVTCTATGSRPQVYSVHFYCINPDLPDGDDDINATSVSSSVTVPNVPESTENNMECFCNASWSPGLFDLNATATFRIQGKTRYDTWTMISGVVGGSLAFLVIVIIVLVIIICRSRNSRAERESKNRVSQLCLEIPELPMQTVNAAVPGPKQGVSMSTLTDGTVYGFGCHNASSSTSRSKKYSDDPVFYSSVSLDDLGKASPTPRPRFHTLTRGQSGHDGEELYHALMHGKLPSVRADTNYSHADLTS